MLEIRDSLRELYLSDARPWLVGYSGGKDSTMLVSMIFSVIESIPREQRTKHIDILCTDTPVEIPAIVEMIEHWMMNGIAFGRMISLGTVSPQWSIAGESDVDGDGNSDLIWQNSVTGECYVWFMEGVTHTRSASLGVVSTDWTVRNF